MHVKIQGKDKEAIVGQSTQASLILSLQEDVTELNSGSIELYTTRPCGKKFNIFTENDILCQGEFEKGDYVRRRLIPISPRIVPTIKERGIKYKLRADVSAGKPAIEIFDEKELIIKPAPPKLPKEKSTSEISPQSVRIQLDKDYFLLGDAIKLSYWPEKDEFKELGFRLIKEVQASCSCSEHKQECSHIRPTPAEIVQTQTFSNPEEGKVTLTIPKDQEPSHSYNWDAHEEMGGLTAFSDQVSWFLSISGRDKAGNMSLNFQIPLFIISQEIEDKKQDNFFVFQEEEQSISLGRKIKLVSTEDQGQVKIFRVKNNTKYDLNGVTIKAASIRNELFEWKPYMRGFTAWSKETEINIAYDTQNQKDITSFQLVIESNRGEPTKVIVRK
ncbi:MAG: hypothetical protein ACFFC7_08260 [Candidatus Hermodarchaeota archaeon]